MIDNYAVFNCQTYHPENDFTEPSVPVAIYNADGIKIILGTDDPNDTSAPDIQIERRHGGWAIFLHPLGGSDPAGYVYFLDDGRSFLELERPGATPELQIVDKTPPELDAPKQAPDLATAAERLLTLVDGDWNHKDGGEKKIIGDLRTAIEKARS